MPRLQNCLDATPRRTLLVIAQQNGLTPKASTPKAGLIGMLHQALLDPDHVHHGLLPRLDGDERSVLRDLLAAGNHLPLRVFRWRYGDIRPYKPWDDSLPRQPWRDPEGPGERPFYLGLLYLAEGPGDFGPQPYVIIPDDLASLLAHLAPPDPAQAARVPDTAGQEGSPPAPDAAVRDVASLLGLLHAWDVRPRHERWLPLNTLRAWNERCLAPEPMAEVRSELRTRRLHVLHFLAEAAGLLALCGDHPKPTPLGWGWLAQDRAGQAQALWAAWQAGENLWPSYRLPGYQHDGIVQTLTRLLPHLARSVTGSRLEVSRYVQEVQRVAPELGIDWERWCPQHRAITLARFVTRFLAGLGVVQVWDDGQILDRAKLAPFQRALLGDPYQYPPPVRAFGFGVTFRFTPLGAWLLGVGSEPAWPQAEPLRPTLAPDGSSWIRVEPPAGANPLHLARLEMFADWGDGRYLLTPASFNRARGRGETLQGLVGLLEEAQAGPLSPAMGRALGAWERAGTEMTLSRPALLECDDPAVLGALARKRRFRQHIVRTLSPRALVLDDARLDVALRHLRREGHDPRVTIPLDEVQARPLDQAGAAFHLLAGRVYQGLARFVRLPAPYPSRLLGDLAETLPPADVAAAEAGARRVLEALASALDGWAPQPSPQPGLDPDVTRPQIEAAIQSGKGLAISYWSAGRGALTHREISPYRLERRGRTLYLVAYCHQAGDERVFRLDRIRKLAVIDDPGPGEEPPADPVWPEWF